LFLEERRETRFATNKLKKKDYEPPSRKVGQITGEVEAGQD